MNSNDNLRKDGYYQLANDESHGGFIVCGRDLNTVRSGMIEIVNVIETDD